VHLIVFSPNQEACNRKIVIFASFNTKKGDEELKKSELVKILKRQGCQFWESGANHDKWKSPNGNIIIVPRHEATEIATGTLKKILKMAGVE